MVNVINMLNQVLMFAVIIAAIVPVFRADPCKRKSDTLLKRQLLLSGLCNSNNDKGSIDLWNSPPTESTESGDLFNEITVCRANSMSTRTNLKSTCPWYYVREKQPDGVYPQFLLKAETPCNDSPPNGGENLYVCKPIMKKYRILRARTDSDRCNRGYYFYDIEFVLKPIGYTQALKQTQEQIQL